MAMLLGVSMAPFLMLAGMAGSMGLPLGVPPAAEEPLMFAVAPDECLFYMTWAGVAEPDPTSTNEVERLVAEPEVQEFLAEIERLIRAGLAHQAQGEGPETVAFVDDAIGWAKMVLTHPTALFVSRLTVGPDGPKDIQGGIVVKVGEDVVKLRASLLKYQGTFLGGAVEPVEIDGKTWYRLKLDPEAPEITWGVRGSCLIVGIGEGAIERILARAATPPPEWLAKLREQLPVERTSTVAYINVKSLIKTLSPLGGLKAAAVLYAAGLANVESLGGVSGLDGEEFVSRTLLAIDGEPQGMIAAITAKSLTGEDLAAIPDDSTIALAAKIDVKVLFDAFAAIVESVDPDARTEFDQGIEFMGQQIGMDVRKELLTALGDSWTVYFQGHLSFTGLTAVARFEDRDRLLALQEKLIAMLQQPEPEEPDENSFSFNMGPPSVEKFQFAGQEICVYDSGQMFFFFSPSWCLTEDELIVSLFPQNIKSRLARDADFRSLAESPRVKSMFESGTGPVAMAYYDTQDLFDMVYSALLMYGQMGRYGLSEEGVDLKMSAIPSSQAIRQHLRPGTIEVRRTAAGIEITSHQSIPGGNLAMTVPLAGLAIPALYLGNSVGSAEAPDEVTPYYDEPAAKSEAVPLESFIE